jgi:flavorubredoxin
MEKPSTVLPDVEILPSFFPIPGAGYLAVNAFVIKASEPVLVDTGMGLDGDVFLDALTSILDPRDLKWIWLTHDDADHTGNLRRVLEAAPNARLVANSLAVLRISTSWPIPMQRVLWLNSGDSVQAGDRTLTAIRPPLFDNPTTIGLYDDRSRVFFSADFFGAIIASPVANAADVPPADLAQGVVGWASLDSPWVHWLDRGRFVQGLDEIRRLEPRAICSGHLPPAHGKTEAFLKILETVPASTPALAPNQAVLEQILAQMEQPG